MKKSKVDAVHKIALQTIKKVRNGHFLQQALDSELKNSDLSSSQIKYCVDLLYSYFRFQIRAEFILQKFLLKPQKLPADMLLLLALAVTSLFWQQGKPDYAIIAGTVETIKNLFGKGLGGVANAALRNIQRNILELDEPGWYACKSNSGKFIGTATYLGIPVQIANLWKNAWGQEIALKLMERSCRRPWKGIRFNMGHPAGEKLKNYFFSQNNPYIQIICKYGIAFSPGCAPAEVLGKTLDQWHNEGALAYQAAGSQLILEKLGLENWREPIWDACAGIGGKTMALLNYNCDIRLVSDISLRRLNYFSKNWSRSFIEKPLITLMDAARPAIASWQGNILADVPCSGLGVLGRRPELRLFTHNFHQRLNQLEKNQRGILESLAGLLRSGKKLSYITCTLNPYENERNIQYILQKNPDLKLEKIWQTPFDHEWLEGMFGVTLIKK